MEDVNIERLADSQFAFDPANGEARVVDFKTAMKPERMRCKLVPSYGTMQTIVTNHPGVFEGHKKPDSKQTVLNVQKFLTSKTSTGQLS